MKQYYLYILASKRNGTLYIGITNNLLKRVDQHKNNLIDGFTKKSIPARKANSKNSVSLELLIPARNRVWIRLVDFVVKNN